MKPKLFTVKRGKYIDYYLNVGGYDFLALCGDFVCALRGKHRDYDGNPASIIVKVSKVAKRGYTEVVLKGYSEASCPEAAKVDKQFITTYVYQQARRLLIEAGFVTQSDHAKDEYLFHANTHISIWVKIVPAK